MPVKEILDKGILHEINRLVLHPAGMAMSIDAATGPAHFIADIWDSRDDPEGFFFGSDLLSEPKREHIRELSNAKWGKRMESGFCDGEGIQIKPYETTEKSEEGSSDAGD